MRQIYDVLRNISQYVSQSFAVSIGGVNRRPEAGIPILYPPKLLTNFACSTGGCHLLCLKEAGSRASWSNVKTAGSLFVHSG